MATPKKPTKDPSPYKIVKKRSGRYAVLNRGTRRYVNGEQKLQLLVEKGLVKKLTPKAGAAKEEAPAENA